MSEKSSLTALEAAVVAHSINRNVELGMRRNAADSTLDVYNGICEGADMVRVMRELRTQRGEKGGLDEYEDEILAEILDAVGSSTETKR